MRDLPAGVRSALKSSSCSTATRILIFDEPTAVLTPQEADELSASCSLVAQGKSIIFITHKLREVLAIANRVLVIRRGKVVGETTPEVADKNSLAAMMVGREVNLVVKRKRPPRVTWSVLSRTWLWRTNLEMWS